VQTSDLITKQICCSQLTTITNQIFERRFQSQEQGSSCTTIHIRRVYRFRTTCDHASKYYTILLYKLQFY